MVRTDRADQWRSLLPVVLFLLGVFTVTWMLPTVLRPPEAPTGIWPILVRFLPVVWAPTVFALILTRWFDGTEGLRRELRARLRYRAGTARWFVFAAVVPAVAMLVSVFAARASGASAAWTPMAAIPTMVFVQVITGALGEELGWRGFLLPRLDELFGRVAAPWTMGVLWSLWHMPAFFTPGMPHQMMPMTLALLSVLFFGVFLAFVFDRAGETVLATILAHLSFNVVSGIGGVQLSSRVFFGTLFAIFAAIALAAHFALRRAGAHSN